MKRYPRIYLSLDSCFAVKRWIEPDEWMRIVQQAGGRWVEVSTDTECDPYYGSRDYLSEWRDKAQEAQKQHGVTIANFFTGYSTYRTAGLLHPDSRIRDRLVNDWFQVMLSLTAQLGAGLGFYIQAFPHSVLQNPDDYGFFKQRLFETIAELIQYGVREGTSFLALEQMYSPHQYPWTIETSQEYLREVYRLAGNPGYLALDTGHATGQTRFLRPDRDTLQQILDQTGSGEKSTPVWLGADSVNRFLQNAPGCCTGARETILDQIEAEMDRTAYLFAQESDCDLYHWIRQLGCYAPVIHLQQTNGRSSAHLSFTPENNRQGIVHPRQVLEALWHSYQQPPDPTLPPRCEAIYLTLELFFGAAEYPAEIVDHLQESIKFWRESIPQDGLSLDSLI